MNNANIIPYHEPDSKDCFALMGKIMDDPKFRHFFNEYFTDWSDIKVMLMIMKTYIFIDDEYFTRTKTRLSSDEIVTIIRRIMNNTELRKYMIDSLNDFIDHDRTFTEAYRKLLINNDLITNKN